MADPVGTIYASVGSDEPFLRLVDHFYHGVEKDALLRPLYPKDLSEPKRNLALFLIQRTGGHATYSQERGHPRMRMRHMPFSIGIEEKDAWMRQMTAALDQVPELAAHKAVLLPFFASFATMLINRPTP